jgi:hypothetical protein
MEMNKTKHEKSVDKITIYFWQNGNVMAFDANNEQIPKIQKQGWKDLYMQWLKGQGYSLDNIEVGGIGSWPRG